MTRTRNVGGYGGRSVSRACLRFIGATALAMATAVAPGVGPARAQSPEAAALPDLEKRLTDARAVTKAYSEKLKVQLNGALKTVGAKAAIGACSTITTEMDTTFSEEFSFDLGRTALKLRNPENAPDEWERANLEAFVKQLAGGADHKTVEAYDVTMSKEGQKLFRYMRPIMTQEICLACHGTSVALDVKAEIARTYTDDKALGFNIGELRGAFTLVQELE